MTSELHRKLWDDTDDKLRDAEASLLRLKSEIDKEQRRIDELRKLQTALAPFVDTVESTEVINADDPSRTTEIEVDDKPIRHADVAQIVLEEATGPLHISDIMTAMIAKGHPLPSDPQLRQSAVYSAMLRRPATFRRVGGGRWALVRDETEKSQVPVRDFADLGMPALARIAFESIGRPATASELAEMLEKLGYEHRKDRRGTSTSIHKAMARNPAKFRKTDNDLGTWESLEVNAQRRLRNKPVGSRASLFPERED